MNSNYLQRFGGIARLYGMPALESLYRASFTIVGIGGVGSWTAEALARSGVGHLTIVDMDDICMTNINRQLHALSSHIGRQKIDVMGERLLDINPDLRLTKVDDFLGQENLESLLTTDSDGVIDAIDSASIKAAAISHCKRNKISLITVGSAGGKRDPRTITSGDLTKTTNDPLLAKTRRILRQQYHFSRNPSRVFSVEAVYSPEHMVYPTSGGDVCQNKNSGITAIGCDQGFGAATMVTATFGHIAAARAIDRFLKRKSRSLDKQA